MSNNKIRLGNCVYDPASRVIIHPDGKEEKLSHIPADVLQLLYSNQHRYISNQELQTEVWAERTVEERSIMRCISTVRKALGETAENKYIETRRNEGYRFIATVSEISKVNLDKFKKPLTALTAIVLVLLLVYSFLLPKQSIKRITPVTLTSLIGQEVDGSVWAENLVFSHKPLEGKFWSLYAKNIQHDRYFKLTAGDYDDRRAVFSPDGKQLAFQRHDGEHCQIMTADFDAETMTLSNVVVAFRCLDELLSVSISWKDNQNLYLSYLLSLASPYQIFLYNLESKVTTMITQAPPEGQGDYYVNFSQASNKLAFLRNIGDTVTEIWIYNPVDASAKKITTVPFILFTLAWATDGDNLVVRTGSGQLSLVNVSNGEVTNTVLDVNYPVRFLFSIDNKTVGYVHGNMNVRNILKVKIGGEPEIIASSSFQEFLPVYAKGSKSMAFVSNRTGDNQIWLLDKDKNTHQLTKFDKHYRIAHLAISNGGNFIAYTINTQIHIIDKEGKQIFRSKDGVIYKNPVFSNDGKTLYYSINYQGDWRVESRSIKSLDIAVNLAPGHIIKPCADSDCLYLLRRDDPVLYKFEKGQITDTGIDLGNIQYSNQIEITENKIYYVRSVDGVPELMLYEMDSQKTYSLTQMPSRQFSIDSVNSILYTTSQQVSETEIEQIYIPSG